MGLLSNVRQRLFRSSSDDASMAAHECLHGTLIAQWAAAGDMGDESKATAFVCSSCGARFTPDEAVEVRQRAIERLRR
jgi:hypothetical protein